MGLLYIPGENEIKGPWLISDKELEELDEIFEFANIKMVESTNLEIEESARIKVQNGRYANTETAIAEDLKVFPTNTTKKVVLISTDEKRLIDSSVKGILKDSKLKDFRPKELNLEIEVRYKILFSLSIKKRNDGAITYNVKCFDQNCQEEIIYKIETWLEKHKPSKVLQIWSEFFSGFILLGLIVSLISALYIVTIELPDFKTIYKNEITQIIKTGVNRDNEAKSIELLLKYTTDYKPDNVKEVRKINKVPIQIFSISFFIFLISIFKPNTIIGIGKNKPLLKFYKFYIPFVLITLPAIFILPPLIEWIKSLIGL